jgi:DNA-binding NarL/FixJ family response regulator
MKHSAKRVNYVSAKARHRKSKIVLVADNLGVIKRLVRQIDREGDLSVALITDCDSICIERAAKLKPDLIVVDLHLGGKELDGVNVTRALKQGLSKVPVLLYSTRDGLGFTNLSLWAGAQGYVAHASKTDNFLSAVRCLLAGGTYLRNQAATNGLGLGHRYTKLIG